MWLVADAHVHIYPCHDLAAALDNAARGLHALCAGPDALYVLCLAEARGHRFFHDLRSGRVRLPAPYQTEPGPEPESIALTGGPGGPLHLVAGRQVISRERLEFLALATDADIPDGLPAAEVITAVADAGGMPVLNWAPGKWFFGRGRLAADLIARATPGQLALCDTTLRPTIWREPCLMRRGRAKGLRLLAGSDPLPFAGEEKRIGTYGIVCDVGPDPRGPAAALRGVLAGSGPIIEVAGQRPGLLTVLHRLKKNHEARRKGQAV